jgi:hypothetical protein
LQAHAFDKKIQYWRDAHGHEIDFVIPQSRDEIDAIECKWDPTQFDPASLKIFRSYYPLGSNYVISPLSIDGYAKSIRGLQVYVCNPGGWQKQREAKATTERELR